MEVTKSSISQLLHGNRVVGVEPVRLHYSQKLYSGMVVHAPVSNNESIFIGSESVTADDSETGGLELRPGEAATLPIDNPSLVFLVSSVPNQRAQFLMG
jgi:hypothetical protein